jgi:hypothetical protein
LRRFAPSATMSSMRNAPISRQAGYISGMLVSLIACIVLLVSSLGFGTWAFLGRQDYKNNSDQKSAKAVAADKIVTQAEDAAQYAEDAKSPLKTHVGPGQFGAITLQYPKTWSAYIIEEGRGSVPVSDYFHPDVVPNTGNKDNAFALRTQIIDQSYDRVIDQYSGAVKTKKVTAIPYSLPKVPNIVGTRIDGQIDDNKRGSMIIVPIRNMTLKIWTESPDFVTDFDKYIVPNFSFSP